jgi:hypothetical protein
MIVVLICTLILFAAIILVRKASQAKSKWGINLNRAECPICQTKQPIVRMPDNVQQMLWGGTTCPKCHTHLDKYGDVIS